VSAGPLVSQMMRLPSTSSPPTFSSRMPTSSGPQRRARQVRTLAQRPAETVLTHRRVHSRSTTQSTHWVSALTSSGSTAGNIATRSGLRPSLRYGSVSTTIGPQDLRDGARVHVVGEVDGADHLRTQLRSRDPWSLVGLVVSFQAALS